MQNRMAGVIVGGVVLALLVFGLWYSNKHPRQIVGTSTVTFDTRRAGSTMATLKTREIEVNGRRFSEVEMPNGTWLDCGGDCGRAARDADGALWERIDKERR